MKTVRQVVLSYMITNDVIKSKDILRFFIKAIIDNQRNNILEEVKALFGPWPAGHELVYFDRLDQQGPFTIIFYPDIIVDDTGLPLAPKIVNNTYDLIHVISNIINNPDFPDISIITPDGGYYDIITYPGLDPDMRDIALILNTEEFSSEELINFVQLIEYLYREGRILDKIMTLI